MGINPQIPVNEADKQLAELVAGPQPLVLGDKEYKVYPLDLAALSNLRAWAKKRIVDETKDTVKLLGDCASEALVAKIWEDAYKQLKDPLVSEAMEDPEAIKHWLYLSIVKGDKTVTEQEIKGALGLSDMQTLLRTLMSINGIATDHLENPQIAENLRARKKQTGLLSS